MTSSHRYTRLDIDGFSRALSATRERTLALKNRSELAASRAAMDHMECMVEELTVADEELRVQTEALEQAQLEIDIERRRYAELFDATPDPYIVTDLNGTILEANRAAGSVLGVQSRFLAGKPLAIHVALPERRRFRGMLEEAAYAATVHECELSLTGRRGEPMRFEVRVARTRHDNAPDELRWLLRDLGIRRERDREARVHDRLQRQYADRIRLLEEALEQERAAHGRAESAETATLDFVARLSHELRTPLQAAVGYVDILKQEIHGRLNMAQSAAIERISHAHEHMRTLLSSLLEIGRVRSGQVSLQLADVPVGLVLARVEELMAPEIARRGVNFTLASRVSQPTWVRGDRTKIEQILLNLLTNAVRYTPAGGSVHLSASTLAEVVSIDVRDTGPGIPADQLEMVFEPFVRLSKDSLEPTGVGLGLAISRELARLMGGDLTVTSTVGRGSTFTLTVPLAASEAPHHER